MSNVAADSQQSTGSVPKKRSGSVVIWLVVLVLAAGAFAAAVVWAGGIGAALDLVGLGSGSGLSSVATPASGASTTTSGSAAPTDTATLPEDAAKDMYREQVQSQANIGRLVNNEVSLLSLGEAKTRKGEAIVPVTVTFRDGGRVSGKMVLKQYDGMWYFFRITDDENAEDLTVPENADLSVVSVIVEQQATPESQDMIVNGILDGGFTEAKVVEVVDGSGTATVKLELSGGTDEPVQGEILCVEKEENGTDYWFVTKFSAE